MLKKNEEYVVNIIDDGCQGEGIAKINFESTNKFCIW